MLLRMKESNSENAQGLGRCTAVSTPVGSMRLNWQSRCQHSCGVYEAELAVKVSALLWGLWGWIGSQGVSIPVGSMRLNWQSRCQHSCGVYEAELAVKVSALLWGLWGWIGSQGVSTPVGSMRLHWQSRCQHSCGILYCRRLHCCQGLSSIKSVGKAEGCILLQALSQTLKAAGVYFL